jgi:hypothetical protein
MSSEEPSLELLPFTSGYTDGAFSEPAEMYEHWQDIAREIASSHGGTVDVRSSDGSTTFTVRLPLRCAAE